jgi:hypothetical protein
MVTVLEETGLGLSLPQPYLVAGRNCSTSDGHRFVSYTLVHPDHPLARTGEGGNFILSVFDPGYPLPGVNNGDLQATLASRTQHMQKDGLTIDYASLQEIDGMPGMVIRALNAQTSMSQEADAFLASGGFVMLVGGFDLASVSRQDQQEAFGEVVSSLKLSGVEIHSTCS